jgi:hypothetical protein
MLPRMKKLPEVEEARAVMTAGMEWGVWKWLLEKRRVRQIADAAVAAFDEAEAKVKASWSDELKRAYEELVAQEPADSKGKGKRRPKTGKEDTAPISSEVMITAQRVKEADEEAYRARMDAEDIFADAERRLSTEGARQGARKALESYDLREKAIRRAESAGRQVSSR